MQAVMHLELIFQKSGYKEKKSGRRLGFKFS